MRQSEGAGGLGSEGGGLYVYDSRDVLRSWGLAVGDWIVVMVIIIITIGNRNQ